MAAHRRTGLTVAHAWDGVDEPLDVSVEDLVGARAAAYRIPARILLVEGDPIEVMCRESAGASMVVVGARGRLPYRGLIGSVTRTLLHHSKVPVVVVRGTPWVPEVPGSRVFRDVRSHRLAA